MAAYLVEMYAPPQSPQARADLVARVHAAAAALSDGGFPVRHVRAIFLPDDETCFHLVDAPSAEVVHEVFDNARVSFTRITQALS